MDKVKIKNIIISKQGKESENYKKFIELVKNNKINVTIVQAGDKIKIDDTSYIQILWPIKEQIKENILNNNSIVAKFVYGNTSVLFTGDIEEIAERKIVQMHENQLNVDILKIAHHGSKTSSISKFIEEATPKIALIGVGKNNNFGHPNKEVLESLKKMNTKIYRTDINGEIIIVVHEKGKIKIKTML